MIHLGGKEEIAFEMEGGKVDRWVGRWATDVIQTRNEPFVGRVWKGH
jgi:hypothetical protein